jgi:hypothetical protein
MSNRSNRLFSEFLPVTELEKVNYFTYFSCYETESSISLLPSDHCLYYPLEFNRSDKKVLHGELNFFNNVLHKHYKEGSMFPISKCEIDNRPSKREKVLFVNIVDNCYGHSFLKQLNLYNIYQLYKEEYDIWVLTPAALKHFVPEDKFFVANIAIGFNAAMNCDSFREITNTIKSKYKRYDFVTLDTYSLYPNKKQVKEFFNFTHSSQDAVRKYVTFYYRSDYFRTWGGAAQNRLITEYFELLKPYFSPETQFIVLGDKDNFKFPESIIDKRTNAFGREVDLDYNSIFSESHMVIGLIGSNMLQPSMFCDFTIHLVPRSKVSIVAEEFFNVEGTAIRNWFNNIYIFGNENLGDLTSEKLLEQTIVLYLTYLAKEYKREIFSDENFKQRISQPEYIKRNYPFFKLEMAMQLKENVNQESFRYNLWRYKISKVLKRLKIYL